MISVSGSQDQHKHPSPGRWRRRVAVAWAILGLVLPAAFASAGVPAGARERAGKLADGTAYLMRIPARWNGTVISDLDYGSNAEGPRAAYFLAKGYGLSGVARHPERRSKYDPAVEIANLVAVLDILEANFGKPKRVIQYGQSGGGHVTLAMAELRPERIDGAVATCAHTPILNVGVRFDTLTALKALLAPDDALLTFAGLADDSSRVTGRWKEVLTAAGQDPRGRARMALAFTLAQWTPWGAEGSTPADPSNPEAFGRSVAHTAAATMPYMINSIYMLERQGALTGTVGADYGAYFANADPAQLRATQALYAAAGLDLQADVGRIAAAPRVSSDPAAVAHWLGNPARTVQGRPKVPVLRIHTTGDDVTMIAQTRVYRDRVEANGAADLYRTAFVERDGHCNFTVAESAAAVETMMRRLDTGAWPSTTAEALNGLGQSLDGSTGVRFVEHVLRRFNGEWRMQRP